MKAGERSSQLGIGIASSATSITQMGHSSLSRSLSRSISSVVGGGAEHLQNQSNAAGHNAELEEGLAHRLTIMERTVTAEKEVEIVQLKKEVQIAQLEKQLLVKDLEIREARTRVHGAIICVGIAVGLVAVALAVMSTRCS